MKNRADLLDVALLDHQPSREDDSGQKDGDQTFDKAITDCCYHQFMLGVFHLMAQHPQANSDPDQVGMHRDDVTDDCGDDGDQDQQKKPDDRDANQDCEEPVKCDRGQENVEERPERQHQHKPPEDGNGERKGLEQKHV